MLQALPDKLLIDTLGRLMLENIMLRAELDSLKSQPSATTMKAGSPTREERP